MTDNSKTTPNGGLSFELGAWLDHTDTLDQGATAGPWYIFDTGIGSRAIPYDEAVLEDRYMDATDAEWIAHTRTAHPQATAALRAVRNLHRRYGVYEHEDACPDTSEEHREERHREGSDDVGEYYCEDMPVGALCDACRDEDGERVEWPCQTVQAITTALTAHQTQGGE